MIKKITLTLIAAICLIANLSAQNDSRLVGRHTTRFNTSWEPADTATYVYSNGNGGDYWDMLSNRLKYDTSHVVYYYQGNYIPIQEIIQTFNGQNQLIEKLTLQHNGTTFENDKKITYTLDGNNNILEELHQDWNNNAWENTFHSLRTWDGNNNKLTEKNEYWNGTTWGSSYLNVYTYDGNNNMLSNVNASLNTTTQVYDSTYRNELHYNTNNLYDTTWGYSWNNGWVPASKTVTFYNTNNAYAGYLNLNWDANVSNWVNASQGWVIFNTNNQAVGDTAQVWNLNTNAWVYFYTSESALNTNGLGVKYLYKVWDSASSSFINNYVDSMDYNSFNQVTWWKRQAWDTTTQSWVGQYNYTDNKYYYELYTADVKNTPATTGNLSIYPSPAHNSVNIDMKWNKAQDFTVAIYDMQGRLVRQWGEKATTEYKKNIPLHNIAPGTYLLQVRGKEATVQEQFVIM